MTEDALKSAVAQRYLFLKGIYTAAIDGDWGVLSIAAADKWALAHRGEIAARLLHANDKGVILSGKGSIGFLRTIAAQIHLADLKLYTGGIDGAWGPLSKSAARMWESIYQDSRPPADKAGTILTPYDVARRYIGTREIPGKNHCGVILAWYRRLQISIFDDETAWCSTFANECAMEAGYERTGKLNARSWLDVGEEIALRDARIGCDVLIFERGTSGWEGHVTFFAGHDGSGYRAVRGLGGNQSDAVNIATFTTRKLLGVRRLRSLDQLQGPTNKI